MARLIAVCCPKCGAEVDLGPAEQLVKCTYCGTSSFVSIEERQDAEDLHAEDDAWERERETEARRAESERQDQARAEREREEEVRLALLRREDELRLKLAVHAEKARERSRRILILVLAALPIGAFLALYLTK